MSGKNRWNLRKAAAFKRAAAVFLAVVMAVSMETGPISSLAYSKVLGTSAVVSGDAGTTYDHPVVFDAGTDEGRYLGSASLSDASTSDASDSDASASDASDSDAKLIDGQPEDGEVINDLVDAGKKVLDSLVGAMGRLLLRKAPQELSTLPDALLDATVSDAGTGTVTVKIDWSDGDNKCETRPDSVTLSLWKDGEACTDSSGNPIATVSNAAEDWTAVFEDVPIQEGDVYEVHQDDLDQIYKIYQFEEDTDDGREITLTNVVQVYRTFVYVTWDDNDNTLGIRPDKIRIVSNQPANSRYYNTFLPVDLTKEQNETNDNVWCGDMYYTWTYDQVEQSYEDSPQIKMTLDLENSSDGAKYYTKQKSSFGSSSYFGNTFYLTLAPESCDYKVSTVWYDSGNAGGTRPADYEVTFRYPDGTQIPAENIVRSGEELYSGTDSETNEQWYRVTATYSIFPYDSSGEKFDPDQITIEQTGTNLDTYYTSEKETYKNSYSSTYTDGCTFYNRLNESATCSFTGSIVWDDVYSSDGTANGGADLRPSKVVLNLYEYNEETGQKTKVQSQVVTSANVASGDPNKWQYTWTGLPKHENDGISYIIEEDTNSLPEFYKVQDPVYNTAHDTVTNKLKDHTHFSIDLRWADTDDPYSRSDRTAGGNEIITREDVEYLLTVHTSGQEYQPGELKITIPYYLLTGEYSTGGQHGVAPILTIPEKNDEGNYNEDYAFYWEHDAGDDPKDLSDDMLVLTNWKTVAASTKFTLPVQYSYNVSYYKDLSDRTLQAVLTYQKDGETQETAEQRSQSIYYHLDTGGRITELSSGNQGNNYYLKEIQSTADLNYDGLRKQVEDGNPLDTANYVYIQVPVELRGVANAEAQVILTVTPEQLGISESHGKLIASVTPNGWTVTENQNGTYTLTSNWAGEGSRYLLGSATRSAYLLFQFPREDIQDSGDALYATYKFHIQADSYCSNDNHQQGKNGETDYDDLSSKSSDLVYEWRTPYINPNGDIYIAYKEGNKNSEQKLDYLKSGEDLTFSSFNAYASVYGDHIASRSDAAKDGKYKLELYDCDLYWNDSELNDLTKYIRMTSEDYEVTGYSLTAVYESVDESTGEVVEPTDEELSNLKLTVQGRLGEEWVDLETGGTITADDLDNNRFTVPSGTYEGKGYTGLRVISSAVSGRLTITLTPYFRIKADSPQVKKWVAEGADFEKICIMNFDSMKLYLRNAAGDFYWANPASAGQSPTADDVGLTALDRANLTEHGGKRVEHFHATAMYTGHSYGDDIQKEVEDEYELNQSEGKVIAAFHIAAEEYTQVGLPEQVYKGFSIDEGVFYDLLPTGYSYVEGSAAAKGYAEADTTAPSPDDYEIKVDSVPNYKNTGRTLLKFQIKYLGTPGTNYAKGNVEYLNNFNARVSTGFSIRYRAETTYKDYWKSLNEYNYVVYYNGLDGKGREFLGSGYYSGSTDAFSTDNDTFDEMPKDSDGSCVFRDLNGNARTDIKECLYDMVKIGHPYDLPAEAYVRKAVTADSGVSVTDPNTPALTHEGGTYSYQLTLRANGGYTDEAKARNVVIYDILEDVSTLDLAQKDEPGRNSEWKGTFQSIDTSVPESQGIKPVVYYSTSSGLSYEALWSESNASQTAGEKHGISNASLWSTEMPADKSKITAVAVDLSKNQDGTDRTFGDGDSTSVTITMKAPTDEKLPLNEDYVAYNGVAFNALLGNRETVTKGNYAAVTLRNYVLDLTGTKTLTGRSMNEGEFHFNVYEKLEDGTEKLVSTGTNKKATMSDATKEATAEIEFTPIAYTAKESDLGEHTYVIREVKGDNQGVTYDTNEYTVKADVELVKNENGSLKITATYPEGGVNFRNTYDASGSPEFTAQKTLTGRNMRSGEFHFELTDEAGNTVATGSNAADGKVSFTPVNDTVLKYTLADVGTRRTYYMREVPGSEPGVTYDSKNYTIPVDITDAGDGTIRADVQYPNGGVVFENVYRASGSAALSARKTLTDPTGRGRKLTAGEFSFEVVDEAGNRVATASNAADGTVEFPEVSYQAEDAAAEVNPHVYTIREIAGADTTLTYDTRSYTARVTVKDNGDGTLSTEAKYFMSGSEVKTAEFRNEVKPPETPPETPETPETPGTTTPETPSPTEPANPAELNRSSGGGSSGGGGGSSSRVVRSSNPSVETAEPGLPEEALPEAESEAAANPKSGMLPRTGELLKRNWWLVLAAAAAVWIFAVWKKRKKNNE